MKKIYAGLYTVPTNVFFAFISTHRVKLYLLLFWLFATFWNIDKAFHIDDAGHLEIAQWIESNPLHPMSGLINWSGELQPISSLNQPHLYFYLMAGWAHFFGYSELSMHLLMSIFSLWSITAFYRISKLLNADKALHATALFSVSSAFVVNQNSMVDIPLLAVWIEFYYALLSADSANRRNLLTASLLCSAAVLIKYTSLVLLPAFLVQSFVFKRIKNIIWVLVPIASLLAWSIFNFFDYGSIHILDRSHSSRSFGTYLIYTIQWLIALGSVSCFFFHSLYAESSLAKGLVAKATWFTFAAIILITPALIVTSYFLPIDNLNFILFVSFLFSGLCTLYINIKYGILNTHKPQSVRYILLYWLLSSFLFIVLFAPFIASRHVLLAIPASILLVQNFLTSSTLNRKPFVASLLITSLTTCLLARADNWYAGIYRESAVYIAKSLPEGVTTWYVGNWGWQWYAQKNGFKHYSSNSIQPNIGDAFVIPTNVIGGDQPTKLGLTEIKSFAVERDSWYQHFSSINLYVSPGLSWGYSVGPMEVFKIYKVTSLRD